MTPPALRKGDKLRTSWSEDVRLKEGGRVYVSTAIETEATTASLDTEMERLTGLMASAHMDNIAAARNEE